MRWAATGVEGPLETIERQFLAAHWPEPPAGYARIGKLRPMRQVVTGPLPAPEGVGPDGAEPKAPRVVVKWNRPVTASDRLARRLRGGRGRREGRLLEALAHRGLPVPRVLGWVDGDVDLLVTEAIEDLQPLPSPDAAPRGLVVAAGRLLGRAWLAGLRHRDLHRDNLGLSGGELVLVDVGGARIASGGSVVSAAGRAASGLTGDLSRGQTLRGLRAFLEAAEGAPSRARLHEVARAAEGRARHETRRYRRGRDRRATRAGRHYAVFEGGIRRREAPEAWEALARTWVRSSPPGATVLKGDGRVVRAHLPHHEGAVVLKRFPPTARGRLPKAIRAFRLAAALEHRGVPAPRALLACSDPGHGSVLVSECVDGVDVHRFTQGGRSGPWANLPDARRRRVLDALGRALRAMHDAEISHRDLKAPNLIVQTDEATGRSTFLVADLDGASRRQVSWKRRARDLARLDASLDARRTERARVLRAYWSVLPAPPIPRKRFARWIADRVARKRGPTGRPR